MRASPLHDSHESTPPLERRPPMGRIESVRVNVPAPMARTEPLRHGPDSRSRTDKAMAERHGTLRNPIKPAAGDNQTMSKPESDLTMIDGVLRFKGEPEPVSWWVEGSPINSFAGGRKGPAYQAWNKARHTWVTDVTRAVKAERGAPWSPADRYAVTLQFRFRPAYENEKRDVDNYIKPVLDGLADGLGVDDSNFRILLIHRLPDAESPAEEGVRLFVSSTET